MANNLYHYHFTLELDNKANVLIYGQCEYISILIYV